MFGPTDSATDSLSNKLKLQDPSSPNRVDKVEAVSFADNGSSGYKFSESPISDIIAHCFGNKQGEEKLKEINDEANKIDDRGQRKQYFEDQLREYAKTNVDDKISDGLKGGIEDARQKYQEAIKEGKIKQGERLTLEEAKPDDQESQDRMFNIFRNTGLNVGRDNFRSDYQEGVSADGKSKFAIYSACWVNRPTEQMKDENSIHRQVASNYADTLDGGEKSKFLDDIAKHSENAKNGQPKMSIADFNKSCNAKLDQEFEKTQQNTRSRSQGTQSQDQGNSLSSDPPSLEQARRQAVEALRGLSGDQIEGIIRSGGRVNFGDLVGPTSPRGGSGRGSR